MTFDAHSFSNCSMQAAQDTWPRSLLGSIGRGSNTLARAEEGSRAAVRGGVVDADRLARASWRVRPTSGARTARAPFKRHLRALHDELDLRTPAGRTLRQILQG
jgi:hypothetical protein